MTPHDDRTAPGPVRTCVGCRERVAKSELLRVTLGVDADGLTVVVPDRAGTATGRGAHLHPTNACLELAVRRRSFARALRMKSGAQAPDTAGLRAHLTLSETE